MLLARRLQEAEVESPAFAVTHWRANGPPPVSQHT